MSKLEELIQELCPGGVKYAKIGEVAECVAGATPKTAIAAYWENGTISWMSSGEVNNKVIYETEAKISQEGYDSCSTKMVPPNTVVIALAGQGKTRGTVAITRIELCTNQSLCSIITKDGLLPDFLYHYLSGQYVKLRDISSGDGTRGGLNLKMIRDFYVPLPPLPVQQEIVRILDSFTGLTAELTAELTARRKQYEYYRDELLTFGDNVPMATLGDVAVVTKLAGFEFTKYVRYSDSGNIIALRGLNVKNGKLDLTDVKYIDNSDFSKLTRSKLHVGDMLFTYVGTIGQVALIDEEDKYYLAPNVALIRSIDDRLSPQYMRYYFQSSNFWKTQINKLLQASSMQNIPMEKIRKFAIPLPSLEEQRRIISSLDRFDALCNDLTSGLPAEIEARQKQYEYYRDKLLKFKSLSRNS